MLVVFAHGVTATTGALARKMWLASHPGAPLEAGSSAREQIFAAYSSAHEGFLRPFESGYVGVELFFLLSGFIVGTPFARHAFRGERRVGLGRYYLRRLTRLEPPYFAALGLITVLGGVVGYQLISEALPHLLSGVTYTHAFLFQRPNDILPPAWSLEVEIQFYSVAPLLAVVLFLRRRHLRRICLGTFALAMAIVPLLLPTGQIYQLTLLHYIQYFLLGFVMADVYLVDWNERPSQTRWWDVWGFLSLAGFIAIGRSSWLEQVPSRVVAPALCVVVFIAAFRGVSFRRTLTNPWVYTIGGMCYSIYLTHVTVHEVVEQIVGQRVLVGTSLFPSIVLQSMILLPAAVTFGGIFFLLIERPCMNPRWPQEIVEWVHRRWRLRHLVSH